MVRYFVRYRVKNYSSIYSQGPYDTLFDAEINKRDIEGYEGVFDVKIEQDNENLQLQS